MVGLSCGARRGGSGGPGNAVFAADFVGRRYMRNGIEIAEGDVMTFSHASAAWADDGARGLIAHAPNVPRSSSQGLLLAAVAGPVNKAGASRSNTSGAITTALPDEGLFAGPAACQRRLRIQPPQPLPHDSDGGKPRAYQGPLQGRDVGEFGVYMRSDLANARCSGGTDRNAVAVAVSAGPGRTLAGGGCRQGNHLLKLITLCKSHGVVAVGRSNARPRASTASSNRFLKRHSTVLDSTSASTKVPTSTAARDSHPGRKPLR
jgi:hypothetical protein